MTQNIVLLSIIWTIIANATVPIFPGAEGGGSESLGGRGGQVFEVTNLNNSGTGSLRACVAASGPRTCVFRVAGLINLSSILVVNNPYLTVAGQTAPAGGITLKLANGVNSDLLRIMTHDVVIRYIRVRPGAGGLSTTRTRAGVVILGNAYGVVIDHVSATWSLYNNLGTWGNLGIQHHVTFQNNISAEGLAYHSKGFNTGSDTIANVVQMVDIDVHHNLFMSNVNRNPLIQAKRTRVVNNIIYNSNYGDITLEGGVESDIIGNYIKRGPSWDGYDYREINWIDQWESGAPTGTPSLYVAGNYGPHNTDANADNWSRMVRPAGLGGYNSDRSYELDRAYQRRQPLLTTSFPITIDSVETLPATLLSHVGASKRLDENGYWVNNRDPIDARLIAEFQNGGGQIPATETAVGGYLTVSSGTPYVDSDHDGMPDVWERDRGLNPFDAADGAADSGDGYTWLENFLNGTSVPAVGPLTYEAEAGTVTGSAAIFNCGPCSGGKDIGNIGSSANGTLSLNVSIPAAGTYTMTVYFANGSGAPMIGYYHVNGGPGKVLSFPVTGSWGSFSTVRQSVPLDSAVVTIRIDNNDTRLWVADIDKIAFTIQPQ